MINYSELGNLLEESLKPELVNYQNYSKQELMERELEVMGTYLSSHPVSDLKKKIKVVDLKDIAKHFNKNVTVLIHIEKTKKIQTKNGQDMLFITGSDETSTLEFVLFPRQFCDIMIGSIYVVDGRVERRLDKYQVIVSRIRKVENEE